MPLTPPTVLLMLPPDSQGFNVQEGNTNIATQLEGGAPRVRGDKIGAAKLVACQWTLGPANYDYMMAFYRTAINNGADPFNITLVGIDSSTQTRYIAWFAPNTFKLAAQKGLTYVISAQMWVMPGVITTDAATIAAGPQP